MGVMLSLIALLVGMRGFLRRRWFVLIRRRRLGCVEFMILRRRRGGLRTVRHRYEVTHSSDLRQWQSIQALMWVRMKQWTDTTHHWDITMIYTLTSAIVASPMKSECISIRLCSHARAFLPLTQGELSFQPQLKVSSNRQDIMVLYPIIESESPSEIPALPSDSVSHSLPEL